MFHLLLPDLSDHSINLTPRPPTAYPVGTSSAVFSWVAPSWEQYLRIFVFLYDSVGFFLITATPTQISHCLSPLSVLSGKRRCVIFQSCIEPGSVFIYRIKPLHNVAWRDPIGWIWMIPDATRYLLFIQQRNHGLSVDPAYGARTLKTVLLSGIDFICSQRKLNFYLFFHSATNSTTSHYILSFYFGILWFSSDFPNINPKYFWFDDGYNNHFWLFFRQRVLLFFNPPFRSSPLSFCITLIICIIPKDSSCWCLQYCFLLGLTDKQRRAISFVIPLFCILSSSPFGSSPDFDRACHNIHFNLARRGSVCRQTSHPPLGLISPDHATQTLIFYLLCLKGHWESPP